MIQTKTLKEALKDPGVIEVVEELIGEATATKGGLFPSRYYHYACPITVYDSDYHKIKIAFTGGNQYVFVHIQTKTSAYLIDFRLNEANCLLLYGKTIPIFVNFTLLEIYIGTTDYRKATIVQPFGRTTISFERFKDGKTAPTEEDGIKIL